MQGRRGDNPVCTKAASVGMNDDDRFPIRFIVSAARAKSTGIDSSVDELSAPVTLPVGRGRCDSYGGRD
jgi:hypothetical protein